MKPLFQFQLDSKIAVYVPSTQNVSSACDNSMMVKKVLSQMCTLFGGASSNDVMGGWISDDKGLIIEKVTIVYSYCTKQQAEENLAQVYKICQMVKKEMAQECVTLEYNNQVAFV